MHDSEILQLFTARSERAIAETEQKYGRECRRLAARILGSDEDAEECFSDALMKAWSTIPPQQIAVPTTVATSTTSQRFATPSRRTRCAGTILCGEII